jgi:hypothetical protein
LTTPHEERVTVLPEPPPPPAPKPAAEAASAPAPPAPPPAPEVAHVLVAYKGAKNAPAKAATRTKDQARKLAEDVAKRAAKEDFAALAKRTSDDATTAAKGGALGALTPTSAPKPLYDAATGLAPGAVSAVIETDQGFHVLKRPAAPGSAPPAASSAAAPPAAPRPGGPPTAPHAGQAPPARPPQNPGPRPKAPGSR